MFNLPHRLSVAGPDNTERLEIKSSNKVSRRHVGPRYAWPRILHGKSLLLIGRQMSTGAAIATELPNEKLPRSVGGAGHRGSFRGPQPHAGFIEVSC
jgi:hypothetical protein